MKIATPSLSLRLSVSERLFRCRFWKSGPSRGPPMVSASRLGGVSILMTSAPKSASWRTQVGPARTRERSRTRKRASAVEAGTWGMANTGFADEKDRYDNLSTGRANVRSRSGSARNPGSRGEAVRDLPDGILARHRPRAALPDRVRSRPHAGGVAFVPHPRGIRRSGPSPFHRGGGARGDPEERRERRRLPRPDVHHGHGAAALQRGPEEKVSAEDRDRRAAPAGLRRDRAQRRHRHLLDPHHGVEEGRPLRDQRAEGVDLARRALRPYAAPRPHHASRRSKRTEGMSVFIVDMK